MAQETFKLGRKAAAYYSADVSTRTTGALIGDYSAATDTTLEKVQDWLFSVYSAGQNGTVRPTLALAGNVTSVELNISSDYADGTTRETAEDGFASQIPVLRNGEISFEARWKPEDPSDTTSFTKLMMEAWENDSPIALAFFDQPFGAPAATGSVVPQGLVANWLVSLSKSEDLRDVQRLRVSLTISDSAKWFSHTFTTA